MREPKKYEDVICPCQFHRLPTAAQLPPLSNPYQFQPSLHFCSSPLPYIRDKGAGGFQKIINISKNKSNRIPPNPIPFAVVVGPKFRINKAISKKPKSRGQKIQKRANTHAKHSKLVSLVGKNRRPKTSNAYQSGSRERERERGKIGQDICYVDVTCHISKKRR